MSSMMGASNLLNSIKSYTLNNINADIRTISTFVSVPFDGEPNSTSNQTPEYSPAYITCGQSKCGSESEKKNEICAR